MENTKEIDHSTKWSDRKIETYRRRTERRWIHGDELGGGGRGKRGATGPSGLIVSRLNGRILIPLSNIYSYTAESCISLFNPGR